MSDLLTWWQAVVLGVIQGLTEFLPISSSGHLALAEAMLRVPGGGIAFAVLLHAGTLLAIALVFSDGIRRLIRGALSIPAQIGRPLADWSPEALLAAKVAVATLPGAVVGLFFSHWIENAFARTDAIGILLLVTAAFLLATKWIRPGEGEISWSVAWLVGFAQAFAILPGISRSGATITMAIFLGVARPRAAEFSFLAAIPLILGSLVYQIPDLAQSTANGALGPHAAGFFTSFVVGWAALVWLVKLVQRGQLHWFSVYCVAAGVVGILY